MTMNSTMWLRLLDALDDRPVPRALRVLAQFLALSSPSKSSSSDLRAWQIGPLICGFVLWSRLVSNQRPSACEADALPLSYETREVDRTGRTTSKISTRGRRRPESARTPLRAHTRLWSRDGAASSRSDRRVQRSSGAGRVRRRVHRHAVRKSQSPTDADDVAAGADPTR